MKINRFYGKQVHGYMDFDIKFYNTLNILLGMNGSGKTTILKLINAFCSFSLEEIVSIKFKKMTFYISLNETSAVVEIEKHDSGVTVITAEVDGIKDNRLELPNITREYGEDEERDISTFFSDFKANNSKNSVIRFFEDQISPAMFLGIDRGYNSSRQKYRNRYRYHFNYEHEREHAGSKGHFFEQAKLAKEMIFEYNRGLRNREAHVNRKFRAKILMTSFELIKLKKGEIPTLSVVTDNQAKFYELESKLSTLFEDKREFSDVDREVLKRFFSEISEAVAAVKSFGNSIESHQFFQYLINYGQFKRLENIVELTEEFERKRESIFSKIKLFLDIINSFYKDSGKEVSIDQVGKIVVKHQERKVGDVTKLSSGEIQLFVIFSLIMFTPNSKMNSDIFLIDEPEVSLHLKWQYSFLESLEKILGEYKDRQVIIATHSPEILSSYEEYKIKM